MFPVNEDTLNFILELMSCPAVEQNLSGRKENAAGVASNPFDKLQNPQ